MLHPLAPPGTTAAGGASRPQHISPRSCSRGCPCALSPAHPRDQLGLLGTEGTPWCFSKPLHGEEAHGRNTFVPSRHCPQCLPPLQSLPPRWDALQHQVPWISTIPVPSCPRRSFLFSPYNQVSRGCCFLAAWGGCWEPRAAAASPAPLPAHVWVSRGAVGGRRPSHRCGDAAVTPADAVPAPCYNPLAGAAALQ